MFSRLDQALRFLPRQEILRQDSFARSLPHPHPFSLLQILPPLKTTKPPPKTSHRYPIVILRPLSLILRVNTLHQRLNILISRFIEILSQ
jgi:hypothetical protein